MIFNEEYLTNLMNRQIIDAPCGEKRKLFLCAQRKEANIYLSEEGNICKEAILKKDIMCSANIEVCCCPSAKQLCDKILFIKLFTK